MLRVTQKDYNFFLLCSFIKTPPADPTKLVKAVQTFRSKLSLKWLDLILDDENPVECLKYVWLVLFKISTHEDATVRVSVYNAIGGLLFTILPFSPHHIMNSFSEATREYKMTTRASICIVSSFLYICHFISPSDLEDFVTNTPVIPHFGADVSGFIQYIPKFVRLMKPLDVQFHKVLLRSLLSSFGRKPNHDFVKSVVLLVALNPEVLIKDLMEFIISNSLSQTILAIGPQILLNDSIFELLSENYISQFLDASLSVLSNTESILSDFEQACGTLSILVNRYDGEKLENLKEKIKKNTTLDDGLTIKEYPKHFQRLLLQLPTPIDDLQIDPSDLNSIKCAKITALVNFARKTDDKEPVLAMLSKLNEFSPSGDVLTSLINSLQPLFPILLKTIKSDSKSENENDIEKFREENKVLSDLIRSILLKKKLTWLQNVSLLNLLLSIGIDLGNKLIPDFESIVIPLILEFACSPQNELSSVATSTLGAFVNLKNVQVVKSFLWSVNYFDPQLALPFVDILNIVADSLNTSELVEFCGLVSELIIFYPNEPEIVGNAFNFLEKCKYYEKVPNELISSCIDWITRLYLSITQNSSKVSSPLKNEALTPLISMVETDVVASDLINIRSKLLPLLYCYNFFISLKGILSPYCILFTKELTRIFPDAIIPILMKVPMTNVKSDYPEMPEIVCSILKCAPSLETAADCCEFLFTFASNDVLVSQKDLVQFFVKNPRVVDGNCLFQFYRFLMKVGLSKSDELLSIITGKLDPVNLAIFEMKLGTFSISHFKKFKSTVNFEDWPEIVLTFFKEHTKLENCDFQEELNDEQLNSLDFCHFSFIYKNKERFIVDQKIYEDYLNLHRHFMLKLEFHYVEKKFTFQPISEDISKEQTILCTVINSIKNNEQITVKTDALIRSFFSSTRFRVTQKVIDDLLGQINSPKTALALIQYADKFKFNVSDEALLSLAREIQKTDFDQSDFESFLIVVSKRIGCDKVNELEELLSSANAPSSCLSFPSSLKLWYSPDAYLNELRTELFMNGEEIVMKSKKLRAFCRILSESPKFTANELFSFLSSVVLSSMSSYVQSPKKILTILRILNESLSLHKKDVAPQFIKELNEKIVELQSSSISLVFNEFSMLFSTIFEISEETEIFTFCESFDKVVNKTALFIVPQSVALSRYSERLVSNRITKSGLSDQLSIEIPSQRLHAIRALDTLLNCRPYWTLVVQVLPTVVRTYQEFSNRPFFDTLLVKFSTILSSDVNFESIRSFFTQKVLPFFFVEPNKPSFAVFAEAASVATQQVKPPLPSYLQFIDNVMRTKPIEPHAGHYYREFVQWLLKYERDPVRRSDILLEELSVMQKVYAADPSIENSEGLIEAIHQPSEGSDVVLLLFGKVALLNITRLQIVVLIHKYYRNASEDDKANCRSIFESLSDSYEPDTSKAIRLVLEGKPLEAALC